MTEDQAPAYRWVIVAAVAGMLAVAMGLLVNGLSVFFIPLEEEFGWTRGSIALINSIGLIGIAFGGIVMGAVADRIPIRRVSLIAALCVGLCLVAASRADQLWQFYALFFVAGAVGGGAVFAPLIALVGAWFSRGAGLAIGLASAGQAVGQGGVPFGAALLIDAFGWSGAFLALGIISLALLVPLALLMREPPARPAQSGGRVAAEPPPPLPAAIVVPAMSLAVLCCCTTMAVPLMHLVPLIQGKGIPAPDAGGVLFLLLLVAVAGRFAFGWLADIIGPIPAYMTASAWQTVLVFVFVLIDDLGTFYAFAPIYGFGYAGVMTGVLVTARALTAPARRATQMGVILSFGWLGHGLGGFQGGHFFDMTGHYHVSFANAALAGLLNLAIVGTLLVMIRRRRVGGFSPSRPPPPSPA